MEQSIKTWASVASDYLESQNEYKAQSEDYFPKQIIRPITKKLCLEYRFFILFTVKQMNEVYHECLWVKIEEYNSRNIHPTLVYVYHNYKPIIKQNYIYIYHSLNASHVKYIYEKSNIDMFYAILHRTKFTKFTVKDLFRLFSYGLKFNFQAESLQLESDVTSRCDINIPLYIYVPTIHSVKIEENFQ